jgi:hypothetical protein
MGRGVRWGLVVCVLGVGALLAGILGVPAADQAEPRLIGLVELPGLFGTPDPDGPPGALLPGEPTPVPLHAEPEPASVRLATVSTADSIEWLEFDYEAPAAVAYGVAAGWVRVALREGDGRRYGWVPPEHQGTLHRLGTLLEEGLAYMTSDWDGLLRETPATTSTASRLERDERERTDDPADVDIVEVVGVDPGVQDDLTEVDVVQVIEIDGVTWLQVDLRAPGRCPAAAAPAVVATGWVPALADDGRPNAWFHSRGC